MTIAITKEDIPLKLLHGGGVDVDVERLNINLSRALTLPRNLTLPIIETAVADAHFPVMDMNDVDEAVTGLVRLIKTYARPVILRHGLNDNGLMIINPRDFYNIDDVIASYTFTSFLHARQPGQAFIDVTGVAASLMEHGLLKEDERATFGEELSRFVTTHKNWGYANLTPDRFVFEERVREIATIFIDDFIFSRWYVGYLDKVSDKVSDPYFIVDKDMKIDLQAKEQLSTLLIALGYMKIDDFSKNEELPFEEILEKMTTRVYDHILSTVDTENIDDVTISELSRLVNLNFLNGLYINALDGNTHPDKFDYNVIHNLVYTQAEIEHHFLDSAVSMIRPDTLRGALHEVSGLPLASLQDEADALHETMTDIFKRVLEDHLHEPHLIFHSIVSTLSMELQAYAKKLEENK